MPRNVTRADVARLKGVSKQAISKACKGSLAPACDGNRVNLDHPAAKAYLGDAWPAQNDFAPVSDPAEPRPAAPTPTEPRPEPEKAAPKPTERRRGGRPKRLPDPSQEEDVEQYLDLTLRELIERFGTSRSLKDYLDARKTIEDIRAKRLSNESSEGSLISRDLVKTHMVGAIDGTFRRLLTDTPKTLAQLLYAAAGAGKSTEDAETVCRDQISSQLKPLAAQVAKAIRDA